MRKKLIDKDALIAWLKERIREYWSDSENTMGIFPYTLEEVIKYVDTLEVKEVDLEKEIHNAADQYDINNNGNIYWEDIVGFAKHFFELGLKAKGE